jgi:hypothetical protein
MNPNLICTAFRTALFLFEKKLVLELVLISQLSFTSVAFDQHGGASVPATPPPSLQKAPRADWPGHSWRRLNRSSRSTVRRNSKIIGTGGVEQEQEDPAAS